MKSLRTTVAATLFSATLTLASVPSVAMADMVPSINFPHDVPRLAMPHIDDGQLINDGSLYYDIITEANASGEAARSADYAYGAVETDEESHSEAWVPVAPSGDPDGEVTYGEAWRMCMDCEVDISEVPWSRRKSSSIFSPLFPSVTIQVLDEDGDLIEDRVPMTPEDAMKGGEGDRTFRFSSGPLVTFPSKRYTLRIIEGRLTGDDVQDIMFYVNEDKDFVILDDDDGESLGAGQNEQYDTMHKRTLCRRAYPSGAIFSADMWVDLVEVDYEHTEVLYDPTAQDDEFTRKLERAFPDGCTAAAADRAWTSLLWSRAYEELNPGEDDGVDSRPSSSYAPIYGSPIPLWGGVLLVASVIAVLLGTVVALAAVTRRPSRRDRKRDRADVGTNPDADRDR